MFLLIFVTAKSCFPSPLKSPTATEKGEVPTAKFVAAPNDPVPSPSSMDTLLETELTTTRSCFPSPLKSPTATETGLDPTAKFVAGLNVPSPLPGSTDTLGL